jgi:hypothetical protein
LQGPWELNSTERELLCLSAAQATTGDCTRRVVACGQCRNCNVSYSTAHHRLLVVRGVRAQVHGPRRRLVAETFHTVKVKAKCRRNGEREPLGRVVLSFWGTTSKFNILVGSSCTWARERSSRQLHPSSITSIISANFFLDDSLITSRARWRTLGLSHRCSGSSSKTSSQS